MTELLLKKFIKDYKNVKDTAVRESYGKFAGTVGIIVNIFLFIIKLIAAIASGFAISVLADALNNLFDAGSSVVTTVGFKIAGKDSDEDHPFGMGRFEYISGLIVSFIIMMVGFELFKESFAKIFSPETSTYSIISIIIMAIAIIIKVALGLFDKKLAKAINSATLNAAASDSFCDVIATIAVLIGLTIGIVFNINIDGYIGAIVAGFIIYTGFGAARDTVAPLLGTPPEKELVDNITDTVLSHDIVIGIHDMIIHDYGPGRSIISLHAEVPSDKDILQIHDEIDNIEMQLKHKFHCDATIHMDPVDTSCQLTTNLKQTIEDILSEIDKSLSFHDFRVVTGPSHTNLIFDIVAPFKFKMTDSELISEVNSAVKQKNDRYFCVIKIDKDYTVGHN